VALRQLPGGRGGEGEDRGGGEGGVVQTSGCEPRKRYFRVEKRRRRRKGRRLRKWDG